MVVIVKIRDFHTNPILDDKYRMSKMQNWEKAVQYIDAHIY